MRTDMVPPSGSRGIRTLGVIGAGQLGRMLHQAAITHMLDPAATLRFLAEHDDDPAVQVGSSYELGAATSADDLIRFAKGCDGMTFEHELVNLGAVREIEREGVVVRPSAAVLGMVADKVSMRRAVGAADLPVPQWRRVADPADLDDAINQWSMVVIKRSRGGYDGRGVYVTTSAHEAKSIGRRLLAADSVLLVEPVIEFVMEAAVIVARRPGGQAVVYDPVRTVQFDGQCCEVVVPSGLPPAVSARCREMGLQAAEVLDVVGLLAIEFFVLEGGNFPVLAVVSDYGLGGSGIGDGEVPKSAKPGEASLDGFAVESGSGVHADDIAAIEVEALGDFEMAITPGKFGVGEGIDGGRSASGGISGDRRRIAMRNDLIQTVVGGVFQLLVVENQGKWPAAGLLSGVGVNDIEDFLRLGVVEIFF